MSVWKVTRTVEEFWNICARCGKEYKLQCDPEKVPLDTTEPCRENWCRECWLANAAEKARDELAYLVGSVVTEFRISENYRADLESIRIRASDGRMFDVSVRRSYGDEDRGLDVEEVKP